MRTLLRRLVQTLSVAKVVSHSNDKIRSKVLKSLQLAIKNGRGGTTTTNLVSYEEIISFIVADLLKEIETWRGFADPFDQDYFGGNPAIQRSAQSTTVRLNPPTMTPHPSTLVSPPHQSWRRRIFN